MEMINIELLKNEIADYIPPAVEGWWRSEV